MLQYAGKKSSRRTARVGRVRAPTFDNANYQVVNIAGMAAGANLNYDSVRLYKWASNAQVSFKHRPVGEAVVLLRRTGRNLAPSAAHGPSPSWNSRSDTALVADVIQLAMRQDRPSERSHQLSDAIVHSVMAV